MTQYLFANNPITTLAAPISASSTSLAVLAGAGSEFPSPSTGQGFLFTLQKAGNVTVSEICLCTARSGDTFTTVTRAQENTVALTWNAGDTVTLLVTAGGLNSFLQTPSAQAESYTYSSDVGSANNYLVALSPSLATLTTGQKFRFVAAHSNTGNCTFNGAPLLLPSSGQVPPGTIIQGGYYEVVYITGSYQLNLGFNYNYTPLFQPALTGVPTAPTAAITDNSTTIATTAYVHSSFQIGSNSNGTWVEYPNGVIEQWGETAVGGTSTTVTFPKQFTNACKSIMVTPIGQYASSLYTTQPSASTSQFTITYVTAGTQFSWWAAGS